MDKTLFTQLISQIDKYKKHFCENKGMFICNCSYCHAGELLSRHLGLIKTVYDRMMNNDLYNKVKLNTFIDDDGDRAYLDYFLLIMLVNQLGYFFNAEIIKNNQFSVLRTGDLPLRFRIKFYRDKVVEHWPSFLETIGSSRELKFKEGKPAIPNIGLVIDPGERKKIVQDMEKTFRDHEVNIDMTQYYNLHITSSDKNYSDFMFNNLEIIDNNLAHIPCSIIKQLLKFGFPTPICDVDEYLRNLYNWINDKLAIKK